MTGSAPVGHLVQRELCLCNLRYGVVTGVRFMARWRQRLFWLHAEL